MKERALLSAAALAAAALGSLPSPAAATDVVVRVSGIVGSVGVVRVAVCRLQEYEAARCSYKTQQPAQPGELALVVHDVPPGRYAVIAHHDRAGDGVVRKNWLGIPTDGVGVSRNVQGFFGPPEFDRVAIDLSGGSITVPITLKQEPGG